jgi:excisionase family DNA binding protein
MEKVTRLAVTPKEAASMLSVSRRSIDRLIQRGELHVNRKLRTLLIPVAELERFLKA